MSYDFIIAGGGIAGLTTAIALQKEGYHIKVLERKNELIEVGAGLCLGANAWKVLVQLGIANDIRVLCNPIKSTKFLDEKGNLISKMDFQRKFLSEEFTETWGRKRSFWHCSINE